ncbi:hypothetical protein ACIQY8_05820 [Streptomyces albidoflavus]
MTRPLPPHGTLSRGKYHGCTCEPCGEAQRAYARRRYRQMGYGTWQPTHDADPVREHIKTLRAAGHTISSISLDAYVSAATLARIVYAINGKPPAASLAIASAQRILAIKPTDRPSLTPGSRVDATGARRRIQALVAMGWPVSHLEGRLGIHRRQLTHLTHADRAAIATVEKVAERYRMVHTLDPLQHGVPQQVSNFARSVARRNGWHGPAAWEDIDDPACEPEIDERPAGPGRPEQIDDERVRLLVRDGHSNSQIAVRLGCSKRAVERSRNRTKQKEAAA